MLCTLHKSRSPFIFVSRLFITWRNAAAKAQKKKYLLFRILSLQQERSQLKGLFKWKLHCLEDRARDHTRDRLKRLLDEKHALEANSGLLFDRIDIRMRRQSKS